VLIDVELVKKNETGLKMGQNWLVIAEKTEMYYDARALEEPVLNS
jgi:hypothetical protein